MVPGALQPGPRHHPALHLFCSGAVLECPVGEALAVGEVVRGAVRADHVEAAPGRALGGLIHLEGSGKERLDLVSDIVSFESCFTVGLMASKAQGLIASLGLQTQSFYGLPAEAHRSFPKRDGRVRKSFEGQNDNGTEAQS
jgi:hypothetical protein